MILPSEIERMLDETLEKINNVFPTHSKSSCDDENLYNRGAIFLLPRCERCEALERLRLWRVEHEYNKLKASLAKA